MRGWLIGSAHCPAQLSGNITMLHRNSKRSRLSLKKKQPVHTAEASLANDNGDEVAVVAAEGIKPQLSPYCGLTNTGNTCYINAVVQSLRFCPRLQETLTVFSTKNNNSDDDVIKKLYELFNDMMSSEATPTTCITPDNFVQSIQSNYSLFTPSLQHDTQELLHCLLSTLVNCTALVGGANDTPKPHPQLITSFFKPTTPTTTPVKPNSGRGIKDIFEGALQFNTTCLTCEEYCTRNDQFLNLTVPVMSCDQQGRCGLISIYHALNIATSMDWLTADNKYWCSGCGHLTEGRRDTLLSRLPSIMILHINRFIATPTNYSRVQIHKTLGNIALPLIMSFKQWTTPTCNHRDDPYQLFALVIHTGTSCRSGHYTAIINTGEKWAWFDDDSVTLVSHDFVINDLLHPLSTSDCTPYIVFYKRIIN